MAQWRRADTLHSMTRRWHSLLMLWLALCLPLQGFAAASGLWCAKFGFHAPAWAVAAHLPTAAAAHHAPGQPPADLEPPCHAAVAGTTGPAGQAAADPGLPAVQGDAAADSTLPSLAQTGAAADGAGALGTCAHCAACHASALLPAPAAAPGPASAGGAPAAWAPTSHAGPCPQGLERPPRLLLR